MIPEISGLWRSEQGGLPYRITQVGDRFVWETVHRNGVLETGIGGFLPGADEAADGAGARVPVDARWNFHGGAVGAPVRSASGQVILQGLQAVRIEWSDGDHFQRVL